jgi:hypothetical protein
MASKHTYSLPLRETIARSLLLVGILLAFAWGLIQYRVELDIPWWLDTPAVFGFYGLLYGLLDAWAWRQPPIARILRVPILRGTWRGTIRSSHDDFRDEIDVVMTIEQSWSQIQIVLDAPFSRSRSMGAHITTGAGSESFQVVYEYENIPHAHSPRSLHAHRGTARLLLTSDGHTLEGEYYTGRDRQSFGRIVLRRDSDHG